MDSNKLIKKQSIMLKPGLNLFQLIMLLILTLAGTHAQSSGESRYGPVSANENLWNISIQLKPDDKLITTQVALSIFRRNPQAFRNNNLNGLLQGKILIIPSATEMHSVSQQTAEKMFIQHLQNWKNGKTQAENSQAAQRLKTPPATEIKEIEKISHATLNNTKNNIPVVSMTESHSQNLPVAQLQMLPQSKKEFSILEIDTKESSSQSDKLKTQLPVQTRESLLMELANNTIITKQPVQTNEVAKKNYFPYMAGFVSILIILFLLLRKQQTDPGGRLCADETEQHDEVIKREEISFSISNDGAEKNEHLNHQEKLQARLETLQLYSFQQQSNLHEKDALDDLTDSESKSSTTEYSPQQLKVEFDKLASQSHINNFIGEFSDINEKLSATYSIIERDKDNKTSLSHFLMHLNMIKQIALLFDAKYVLQYSSGLVELLQCQLNSEKSINKQLLGVMSESIACNEEIINALREKRQPGIMVKELIDKADIIRRDDCQESRDEHISKMVSNF